MKCKILDMKPIPGSEIVQAQRNSPSQERITLALIMENVLWELREPQFQYPWYAHKQINIPHPIN